MASLPAAPYYMAQAILVQEQALSTLQNRVQELEQAAAQRRGRGGGGFLGGLFGGGAAAPAPRPGGVPHAQGPIPPQYMQPGPAAAAGSPWGRPAGGGFLAGAMQTAMGVAGGMLVADAISSAFSSTPEVVERGARRRGPWTTGWTDDPGRRLRRRFRWRFRRLRRFRLERAMGRQSQTAGRSPIDMAG